MRSREQKRERDQISMSPRMVFYIWVNRGKNDYNTVASRSLMSICNFLFFFLSIIKI